jgi:hypothetical protein
MRRVRVVLLQSAIGGAAALRRHTQAGDDDGAHHSPRPLVKTRRYESSVAPARQTPPKVAEVEPAPPAKVQQLEAGERGAGQRLDNFLGRILKDVPKTHIFRVIRKGEVRVNGKRAKPDQRLLASDIVRVPPVRTGAAAPSKHSGLRGRRSRSNWSTVSIATPAVC